MLLLFGDRLVPLEVGEGALIDNDETIDPVLEFLVIELYFSAFLFNCSGINNAFQNVYVLFDLLLDELKLLLCQHFV